MKKCLIILSVWLFLVSTVPLFSSCGLREGEAVIDDYGYERPDDAWLVDCLLLPLFPMSVELDEEIPDDCIRIGELFGTSGKSGILSEKALEMDGLIGEDGECYLIYLICITGEIPDLDTKFSRYFNIACFDGNHLAGCNQIIDKWAGKDYNLAYGIGDVQAMSEWGNFEEMRVSFNFTENGISQSEIEDGVVCGGIVIPLQLDIDTEYGALGTTLNLTSPNTVQNELVNDSKVFCVGSNQIDTNARIENLDIRYMSQSVYDVGTDINDISNTFEYPVFKDGNKCYAILNFDLVADGDNNGDRSVMAVLHIQGNRTVDVRIESAPTGKIETISTTEGTAVCASFGVPQDANGKKQVTIVFQLTPLSDCSVEMNLIFMGDQYTQVLGDGYVTETLDTMD